MEKQQIILIERYKIHLNTISFIHRTLMNEAKKRWIYMACSPQF